MLMVSNGAPRGKVNGEIVRSELGIEPAALAAGEAVDVLASEMLTDSELESLRRADNEASDFARKAFAHLRPTSEALVLASAIGKLGTV